MVSYDLTGLARLRPLAQHRLIMPFALCVLIVPKDLLIVELLVVVRIRVDYGLPLDLSFLCVSEQPVDYYVVMVLLLSLRWHLLILIADLDRCLGLPLLLFLLFEAPVAESALADAFGPSHLLSLLNCLFSELFYGFVGVHICGSDVLVLRSQIVFKDFRFFHP